MRRSSTYMSMTYESAWGPQSLLLKVKRREEPRSPVIRARGLAAARAACVSTWLGLGETTRQSSKADKVNRSMNHCKYD